ncbi:serine hydrolase domain-containing protein [Marinobacterium nitratireducens]|uniref:serine hydrolase domain-containing protein n=1 Tax=Marinobacterium nitratireducens TaxID=518897 RepID=UPI001667E95D|nr:serine hydrolase [Marinobacterium nitratireducens]
MTNAPVNGVIDESLGICNANWDHPSHLAYSQLHMDRMMPTVHLEPGTQSIPLQRAARPLALDKIAFTDPLGGRAISTEQFLDRRLYNDALLVFHRGEVVHESYRNGMSADDHHVQHSTTKSLVAMLVGIAMDEGVMSAEAPIANYIPELGDYPEWAEVRLQHVLDMALDSPYAEHYDDPDCGYFDYARAVGYYPAAEGRTPAGARAWLTSLRMRPRGTPGSRFNYTSPLTNALMIAVGEAYGESVLSLLESRIYQRIGAVSPGWFNTDHLGVPIAEGQFSLRLEDFARWASLMINNGRNLAGDQVVPPGFVEDTLAPRESSRQAFARSEYGEVLPGAQYRNQFWVTHPEARQCAMLGIHGQFAWFDLNRELMICGYGSYPVQVDPLMTDCLQQLWLNVASACDRR